MHSTSTRTSTLPARSRAGARAQALWRAAFGAGLLGLLAGCAHWVPPEQPVPAVALPAAWSAPAAASVDASAGASVGGPAPGAPAPASPSSADAARPALLPGNAAALAQWWQRFGDAQLSTLVQQALQANPSVRSALAALQQARAQVDVQAAALRPSLNASASAQRSRAAGNTSNQFQAGFDASWEPDLFGRLGSALQASEADARAAEANLGAVQVALAAEVAVNYIDLRGLQQRLAIARSNLLTQRQTLQLTEWRMQAGLTTSQVVEQARTVAEQTAAMIPALQASLDQSRHSLAVLTGQAPAALDALLAAPAAVPAPSADLALEIPAVVLRQRPDVHAAEQRIAAALARVLQADAARYPRFNIAGSLGLSALTFGALDTGDAVTRGLLASVTAPIFDGGAARAQVRVQEAVLAQARSDYEAAVLTALQDVEDALAALRNERLRLTHLQTAAEAAGNAALLAEQNYRSGRIDFQTLLDTQRTLLTAQDNVASSVASVAADHVRLYKALGGGWTNGPALQ